MRTCWLATIGISLITVYSCESLTPEESQYLIEFASSDLQLELGQTATAPVELTRGGLEVVGEQISFISSAPTLVSVDEQGTLRATGLGSATITATAQDETATLTVRVVNGLPAALTANRQALSFSALTDTARVTTQVRNRFGVAIPGTVSWTSHDQGVATVTSTGLVRSVAAGATQVVATIGSLSLPLDVVVSQEPRGIAIRTPNGAAPVVRRDRTVGLAAIPVDRLGNQIPNAEATVVWSSDDPSIATVDQTGVVRGIRIGRTNIRARSGVSGAPSRVDVPPSEAVFEIEVVAAIVGSVSISPTSATMDADEQLQLTATVRDTDGNILTDREVIWTPAIGDVASVNSTGRVTAKRAGIATIRATVDGRSATSLIAVSGASTNDPPGTPALTVTSITGTTATLNGSAFADPDVGDSHALSQWQVDEDGGDWSTPIVDVSSATDRISRALTGLAAGTAFQARVRYQDDKGNLSSFSAVVDFSTNTTPPIAPTVTVNAITTSGATLNGSAFTDPDAGDTHLRTNWQVDEQGGDWSTPVLDVTNTTALTSRVVTGLTASTNYQARARYQDDNGTFSAYGATVSFSTVAPPVNIPPAAPTVTVTAIAATIATLNGSAFSDPDAGNTHAQTHWQVDEQGGDWSTPVFDLVSATSLTSRAVTILMGNTDYKARARYQDNNGTYGIYSAEVSFRTTNRAPNAPTVTVNAITATGATLNGSAFSDPDPSDAHAQTHWQVDEQGGDWSTPILNVTAATNLTSRAVTGLLAGSTYQARARYQDGDGLLSAYSAVELFSTGNTPPNAPTMTVTAITSTAATLNGSAFSDPDGGDTHSQTQWQVDEQGGDWSTPVITVTNGTDLTTRAVTGLDPGTNYQARVRYRDGHTTFGAYSATVSFATTNTAPNAPTVTVHTITSTGATLAGSAFSDPDAGDTHAQTQWLVDEQGGDWSTPVFSSTAATNLTNRAVTGLLPHTSYQARARYQDDGGTFSAYSATVSFSTANTAPAAPTVTVSAITSTGATLNGTAFSDTDGGDTHAQTEWQIDEQGGNWSTTVFSSTAATNLTSRAVTGLSPHTSYQARARHQDDRGTFSAYSATVSFSTANTAPAAPAVTVSAITSTGATLSGTAFSDADAGDTHAQTEWQIDEQGGNWSTTVFSTTGPTNLTSRAITGLLASTNYQARARYQDSGATFGAYGATVSFTTSAPPNNPPNAPTVTVNTITSTGATLNGSAFSDPDAANTHAQTHWQVDEQGGDWSTPILNVTAATNLTSRAVTGLLPSSTYQARARYQDGDGLFSAYSAVELFSTGNTQPNAPTVTVTAVTSTGATLNSSAFSDPDGGDTHAQTQWQVDEQGGDWSTPVFNSTAATNLTSRAVTGLDPGTNYQARVRHQDNHTTFGAYSATVSFATANTASNTPTVTVNTITTTGATLSGSAFSDPDAGDTHGQTQWQVDEQGGDWSTPVFNSTAATNLTSRAVTGLLPHTNYQARARYQDDGGTFSAYSATVNFSTTNTAPGTPTVTVNAITSTGATLNGTAFSDADAGDTHAETLWQVDEQGGNWSTLVVNAASTTALTSRGVTGLLPHTNYQARARYQDNGGTYGAYSATVSFSTTNTAPAAPTVTVNAITSTGATLNGTAFSDADAGDTHAQTEWQIDEQGGNWSTPVFNVTAATSLTSRAVTGLLASTNYQARARYQDSSGTFGAYGATVSFTTSAPPANNPPNAPTVTVSGLSSTGATLNGSAFSDPNGGNTHAQTQWQVDQLGDNFASPVLNVTAGSSLTSRAVSGLTASTAYQARARYQDNAGDFSAYSATVNFTTNAAGGATVLFHSEWDYATGNSRNAVEDGPTGARVWPTRHCSNFTDAADVVTGDAVNWTLTDNVMRITRIAGSCTQIEALPVPGLNLGQDYYIRSYIRNDASDMVVGGVSYAPSNHPVCIGCVGEIQFILWAQTTAMAPAGQYWARLFNRGALAPDGTSIRPAAQAYGVTGTDIRWATPLDNGEWYRFEWFVDYIDVRATDSNFRIYPRVYDMAGNLVADVDDYRRLPGWGGSQTQTLRQWYDAGGAFLFPTTNNSRNVGTGTEGNTGGTNSMQHWYYGAFAVGINDWLGPFIP